MQKRKVVSTCDGKRVDLSKVLDNWTKDIVCVYSSNYKRMIQDGRTAFNYYVAVIPNNPMTHCSTEMIKIHVLRYSYGFTDMYGFIIISLSQLWVFNDSDGLPGNECDRRWCGNCFRNMR